MRLVIFLLLTLNICYAQDKNALEINQEFKENETVYLFGDNVKLRQLPSVDSEVLQLLKIGEALKVIEKSDETYLYNGLNSPWYKVEYNKQQGYVVGGLISITTRKHNTAQFLFGVEKVKEKLYIITRTLREGKPNYFENTSEFLGSNYGFTINLYDNRGIKDINNIIFVNYLPESCGANSGGFYLFQDDKNLYKVIDVTSSADIGFWESENLIFPNDAKGEKDKIIYFKENGQYSEDENPDPQPTWEKSNKIIVNLKWINNKLEPNPKTFLENLNKE